MDVLIDDYGAYHFKQVISVEEGTEFEYKFRIGHGNWWVLDDHIETGNTFPFHSHSSTHG
jgi:hypothetical protein